MLRALSSVFARAFLFLFAIYPCWTTEKTAKESAATIAARKQVEAALRAEAAGDNGQRTTLLAYAMQEEPTLPEANWHSARIHVRDQWLSLSECEERAASEPLSAEYRKLRDEAGENPKLIRGLARWSLKNGWEDVARLHYAQLLARGDIDAETQEEAIRRSDLHNIGGTWVSGDELKHRQDHARVVESLMRKWRPTLKRLQLAIDGEDYHARDRAIKELQAIDDPQVSTILELFLHGAGDRFSEEAVRLLSGFKQVEATEALARYAVLCQYSAARNLAIDALKQRPKQDYLPLLLRGLIAPLRAQFAINVSRSGAITYTQALSTEGTAARYIQVQRQAAMPAVYHPKAGYYSPGATLPQSAGFKQIAAAAASNEAASLGQAVVAGAELTNSEIAEANRRTFEALERLTDAKLQRDANEYWNWWQDYNQYYWPKPTYYAYQQYAPRYYFAGIGASCFVAGTPVRTQLGLRPIESLKPGDRVLAQDQDTGELAFKLVLRTTVRPPSQMTRIKTSGGDIVATLGHPFWVNGYGWKMAKELTVGDSLHSLNGAVPIEKITPAGKEQAYNLVVDGFNTYFVGQQGLLVHDNEFRKATTSIVPGLPGEVVPAAKN